MFPTTSSDKIEDIVAPHDLWIKTAVSVRSLFKEAVLSGRGKGGS